MNVSLQKKAASDHQCIRFPKEALKHFHALKRLPNSSSWFDQVAKLRHDVCQSHQVNIHQDHTSQDHFCSVIYKHHV